MRPVPKLPHANERLVFWQGRNVARQQTLNPTENEAKEIGTGGLL
jgi:hypothetical protein